METKRKTPAAPMMGLGTRLKVARTMANLNQTELATQLGITRGTVSDFETDVREPKRMTILAWAYVTGVEVEWLEEVEHSAEDSRVLEAAADEWATVIKDDGPISHAVRHQGLEPRTRWLRVSTLPAAA